MYKQIKIIRKLDIPESTAVKSLVAEVKAAASNIGIQLLGASEKGGPETLYVAIGGDGTVLYAAKEAAVTQSAVIGFNLGKVGFLADYDPDRVEEIINVAVADWLKVQERTMLTVGDAGFWALNDVVVSHKLSDYVIHYELYVDDVFAGTHTSNSMIFSTPTGSTAYALNTGGAILEPSLDVIEIIPVAAHSMTTSLRPIIVGGDRKIRIKIINKNTDDIISVKCDGQEVIECENKLGKACEFIIKKSPYKAKLLAFENWNFFDVLTGKLHWNH